jgi:hypothetical protein
MRLLALLPSEEEGLCESGRLKSNFRNCEGFDGLSYKADSRRMLAAPIRVIAGFEAARVMANGELRHRLKVWRRETVISG